MTAATATKKKAGHLLEQVPAAIPTPSREIKMTTIMPDLDVRSQQDPRLRCTTLTTIRKPRWATEVEADDETVYHRNPVADVAGIGWVSIGESRDEAVAVRALQETWTDDDGKITVEGPAVEIEGGGMAMYASAAAARQLAHALLDAADVIEGRGSEGAGDVPTQHLVVKAIRARIKAHPLGQNEIAVAAGLDPIDLSNLMTGQRRMDLNDIERIARALGTDPFSLIAEACE